MKRLLLFLIFVVAFALVPWKTSAVVPRHPIVHVYTFTHYPIKDAQALVMSLRRYYPYVILDKVITLPKPTYFRYTGKYRWLSDTLLRIILGVCPRQDCAIALTNADIVMMKPHNRDWGVMGYGLVNGRVSVATNRLFKRDVLTLMTRLSMHELGHAFGLPHCKLDPRCLMQDMKKKNKFVYLNHFCPRCARELRTKGWKV